MTDTVTLFETKHPDRNAEQVFDELIGIEGQKKELLNTLSFLFHKQKIEKWKKEYFPSGLGFLEKILIGTPLIVLSGEVGCGKTALANSIATPLAKQLDKRIVCFETPSNIRGFGKVGELSARITSAFDQVKARISKKIGRASCRERV